MFNFDNLYESIKSYKNILVSIYDEINYRISNIKLSSLHKKIEKEILILNCPLKYINSNYILLDKKHLEVLPHYGLFLKSAIRAFDSYPHIIFLDDNKESLDSAEITLDGALCITEKYIFNVSNQQLSSEKYKFTSISLPFVLDRIKGINAIENALVSYKNLLIDGGVIFGVTIVEDIKHKIKSKNYIDERNKQNYWFNLDIKLENLETIFKKHFDEYSIDIIGSCVIFRLFIHKIPLDINKYKLTLENVGDKYIELN